MGLKRKLCHKRKRKIDNKRGSGMTFSSITKAAKNLIQIQYSNQLSWVLCGLEKNWGERKVTFP